MKEKLELIGGFIVTAILFVVLFVGCLVTTAVIIGLLNGHLR